jgi:hypothetical protein
MKSMPLRVRGEHETDKSEISQAGQQDRSEKSRGSRCRQRVWCWLRARRGEKAELLSF